MITTLRRRIAVWAVTLGGLMLAGVLAVTLVLWPAFRRADRALQPFEVIFPQLAARQATLADGIDGLAAWLENTTARPDTAVYHSKPSQSLLAEYAGSLTPEAADLLATVEEDLATMETELGMAWAAMETGDRALARSVLERVREREAGLALRQRDQMILAFGAGGEARAELDHAMGIAARLAMVWLVLIAGAVILLGWNLHRRVLAPIGSLQQGVERLGRGDWSRRVPETGDIELRRLARHFNGMVDILRRRAGRQAQFATAGELLSGASHELNNPLQAVRALAEIRLVGSTGQDAEDWRTVLDAADRASRLVRDLSRFSRSGRSAALVHDFNGILRSALDLVRFQFSADGIEIDLHLSERVPPVLCDENDMVQALVNLLGNAHAALRGRPKPRRVTITSWREGDTAIVRIADTGPGIAEAVRAHVFDPFFTTKPDGVGLGLPTARDIVEGEGGSLLLDDTAHGTSLTIRLPAAPGLQPEHAPERPALPERSSLEGLRVLVVDDEAAVRDVLRRFLEREGAVAVVVGGGEEALTRAADTDFDAVLLDLRMPDLEGARVYDRWMRERPGLAERTLILSGDLSRLDTATPVPQQRILTKPIELAELKRALLTVGLSA